MGWYGSLGWLKLFPFLNFPSYSAAAIVFTLHFSEVPLFTWKGEKTAKNDGHYLRHFAYSILILHSTFPVLKEKYILEFSMPKSAAYIPAFKQLRLKYSAYYTSATKCRRKIPNNFKDLLTQFCSSLKISYPKLQQRPENSKLLSQNLSMQKKYHVQLLGEQEMVF